jgi:1-acyl-sn-glycerol-3-phosphate acyltransferase
MKSWARHPLRVSGRLLWLGSELLLTAIGYARHCAFQSHDSLLLARAKWLQRSSRRVLRIFQVETHIVGSVPINGLLVCNHLSYLDVLVLAALIPSVFVAKSEVRYWPVFGWFARLAGTIFVDRNKPSQVLQSADEIAVALRNGALVVLFPEGTSSGGQTVLPFKSSLLEPATRRTYTLTAGLIAYELADGDASEEVCYWKDMTLVPHLVNLLSKRGVRASIGFMELRMGIMNRKELARELHAEVLRLREAIAIDQQGHNHPCFQRDVDFTGTHFVEPRELWQRRVHSTARTRFPRRG